MENESAPVFVDSNFFIALFNPSDSQHKKAKELAKHLDNTPHQLLTSNLIFLEIVTVLSQKAGRQRSIAWGNKLAQSQNLHIIHIDEHLHRKTWDIFQSITNKNMSFVDCSALATMRHYEIKKLLTFDKADFAPLQKKYNFTFFE
jgi:uncharacterized protein